MEDLSESKSIIDEKSTRSESATSLATATHENSNVAVYEVGLIPLSLGSEVMFCKSFEDEKALFLQGDWVWLKKFEEGQFKEVKQSTTKILTKVSDNKN